MASRSASIVRVRTRDRVLLLKRAPTMARFPGAWSHAGGAVDYGESDLAAAVRELREETGLVVDPDALIFSGYTIEEPYLVAVFDLLLEKPVPVRLCSEHTEYVWLAVPSTGYERA